MDLDGSSMNSQSEDIDQNLLLQFSCMNTTDREELISQLQKLLGPNINYNTASFFLDMNNWNLQAAVCSYLDYALPARLPSMSIKTVHPPAEEIVGAGTCFDRSWTVQNNGSDYWPGCCQVTNVGGEQFSCSNVYVPPLPPGNTIAITLNLTAPVSSGKHEGHFRLMTERGDYFGDSFIVEITVDTETTIALVEQLAAMPVPSNPGSVQNNVNTEPQTYRQMPQLDDQMC